MPRCTRQGCRKEYTENAGDACQFHPGGPVFHEGLKSWSCCKDTNKPVLDFESFMAIPGCATGPHSEEQQEVQPAVKQSTVLTVPPVSVSTDSTGKEVYSTQSAPAPAVQSKPTKPAPPPAPVPIVEDEDDLDASVQPGGKCLRNGCKYQFVSDEVSRRDGSESTCTYHSKQPIFHEGSKGYLCCKRRVLEFDEFLKIEGCKTGKHVFVKKKQLSDGEPQEEELVQCRIDHYQTPTEVRVSIFGKQADKEKSTVQFEKEQVHVDLLLPGFKRFQRTINLFGSINPETSSYTVYGTKVELVLNKIDGRSWSLLEKTDADLGSFSFTFGVGGRTGTIGAKELVLDEGNKDRS